jgi:serine/threonine-protein kinase
MGQVYRAIRPLLGDGVAVKVMRASFDAPGDGRQRFLRESRACASLRHPNIVSILDFNVDPNGQPYMVMELLSGPSLRDELEVTGPMTPEYMVSILTPVAAALQLAHDRGITHRDLKPANIVAHQYGSGDVYKVIDFAGVGADIKDIQLTDPNIFIGTMAYAAPEQLRGGIVDARTDIYALGVISYEMLTGRRPFQIEDQASFITQTLTEKPIEPSKVRPGMMRDADAVIMRALSKDPAERWSSGTDFARALRGSVGASLSPRAAGSDDPLSRFEVGEEIGRGRLGSHIHRGRHRALGIPVAIRVLHRKEQPNWDAVRSRFLLARSLDQIKSFSPPSSGRPRAADHRIAGRARSTARRARHTRADALEPPLHDG